MATKRKASALNAAVDDEPVDPSDEVAFYCLGGGNEVGRSCHIIQYKGKTVMVCGLYTLCYWGALLTQAVYSSMPVCTLRKKAFRLSPSLTSST